MAELPGWDRARLRLAAPADVRAARWIVYGRAWADFLAIDFDAKIRDEEAVDSPPNKVQARVERRRRIASMRSGQKLQAELRATLELDVEDDAEDEPAEVAI